MVSIAARDLHRDPAGDGLPVEEPAFDVGDGDRAGVVVGLLALVLGAVVPGGAAVGGVADQRVGVQVLQCLSGHGSSSRNEKKPGRVPGLRVVCAVVTGQAGSRPGPPGGAASAGRPRRRRAVRARRSAPGCCGSAGRRLEQDGGQGLGVAVFVGDAGPVPVPPLPARSSGRPGQRGPEAGGAAVCKVASESRRWSMGDLLLVCDGHEKTPSPGSVRGAGAAAFRAVAEHPVGEPLGGLLRHQRARRGRRCRR